MGLWGGVSVVLAVIGLVAGYVRFAPAKPERWHVDPVAVVIDEQPESGHFLQRPGDDSGLNMVFDRTPQKLLSDFEAVALAEPRVTRLAGSPAEGTVTYVARSRFWGFPDMISVRAVTSSGGAQLAIYARQRFGASDMGVNAARMKRWIGEL